MPRSFAVMIVLCSLGSLQASAQSEVELFLIEENPCEGFKSGPLGVDKLRALSVGQINLTLNGDLVEFEASGALECRTSNSALIKDWAGVDLMVQGRFYLTDCADVEMNVDISNVRGGVGEALKPFIVNENERIEGVISESVTSLCRTLKG